MKKTVEESTLRELENYPALMDAIMKYLDQYWDIKAKPKGYDKFLKTYREHDIEEREYEFDGPLDTSTHFPIEFLGQTLHIILKTLTKLQICTQRGTMEISLVKCLLKTFQTQEKFFRMNLRNNNQYE